MSGGAFDFDCFRISNFADELQVKIYNNQKAAEYGDRYSFSDETILLLQTAQRIISKAGKLAHEIEWLYSGNIDEDDLKRTFRVLLQGCVRG